MIFDILGLFRTFIQQLDLRPSMRVLHLGPSEARGGISAVISILTDVDGGEASHSVLNTYSSGNFIGKILAFSRARKDVKAHLKSNAFDIYHIHCASDFSFIRKANYARLLLRKGQRVILHLHSGNIVQWLKEKNRFKRYEDIFSNDRVKVICLSDAWKEQIQPLLGEVHVIENPIHPRHKPSQSKEEGKICLIGRKDSVKGHDFAIELINRLNKNGHEFHLYCTGITYSNSENTTALGWISEQEKVDLLSSSILTLLPSKYEGLPLAALESLACNTPVLANESLIGLPLIVETAKDFDLEDWEKKIIDLAKKTRDSFELIDSVKDYEKEVICQKWQEFYDRIIDSTT